MKNASGATVRSAEIDSPKQQLSSNAGSIDVEARPSCLLCGKPGVPLYDNLEDWLFDVTGKWKISNCSSCGIAWLDPAPALRDFPKLYARYYTHESAGRETRLARMRILTDQQVFRRLGYPAAPSGGLVPKILSLFPFIRRAAALEVLDLPASEKGNLLDVGCGNGDFIARMRSFGWGVSGVDPDAAAVARAQSQGLDVFQGSIKDVPRGPVYDVIALNHVIEHTDDPVGLLRECGDRLRRGTGRLIITTPNLRSLGHMWFKKYWRGLEVPRHLTVFSRSSLGFCVERAGLTMDQSTTETRLARMIYCPSALAKRGGRSIADQGSFGSRIKLAAYLFQAIEDVMMLFKKESGEEIFCAARKL
jgi:2-polyprenyl-3-methyl-5-hydroxy-6-metoxy-1,4-benzoquinol methylase